MALRLSGRLKVTQVMPSFFSTRMVSYFFVTDMVFSPLGCERSCRLVAVDAV